MDESVSWEDAQTFLAVAEAKSFSAAARRLALGQPTVSRRIANLEERLGRQLFWRGKQGAVLTEEGTRLLPAAAQMARWAGEFGRIAAGTGEEVAGTVRIAAPPGLAVELLAPFARIVREHHPEIRLEVLASIEHIDLTRGAVDLAIRQRAPTEVELVALHESHRPLGVFAASSYANTLAEPLRLTDLDWITWAFPYEHVAPRPMLEELIPDFAPVFASDNYLVLKRAVAAGLGAMILERRRMLLDGQGAPDDLVELDVELDLPDYAYYLVCARSMRYVPRVMAIAELLVRQLDRPT